MMFNLCLWRFMVQLNGEIEREMVVIKGNYLVAT